MGIFVVELSQRVGEKREANRSMPMPPRLYIDSAAAARRQQTKRVLIFLPRRLHPRLTLLLFHISKTGNCCLSRQTPPETRNMGPSYGRQNLCSSANGPCPKLNRWHHAPKYLGHHQQFFFFFFFLNFEIFVLFVSSMKTRNAAEIYLCIKHTKCECLFSCIRDEPSGIYSMRSAYHAVSW